MRLLRAGLADAYKVHKTYAEYLHDKGSAVDHEGLYNLWPKRLTDERFFYGLLVHGKKVVGMVWGQRMDAELKPTVLIEGRFLRRAFRGKARFSREMVEAVKSITDGYEVVLMILSKGKAKIPGKYKVLGTLVQVGGSKDGQ